MLLLVALLQAAAPLDAGDWQTRIESVRGAANDKQAPELASWLALQTLLLAGKASPDWQVVLFGLEALQPFAQASTVKALYQTLARYAAGPADVAAWVRCFAAAGLVRATTQTSLQSISECSDDDTGDLLALDAAARGLGGPTRVQFIAEEAKADGVRLRAFAVRAAVFALADVRAAAIVRQTLRSGDGLQVAMVAEAFAQLAEQAPPGKKPRIWSSELLHAAEREDLDAAALVAIRDALNAIDPKLGEQVELEQPASAPAFDKKTPPAVSADPALQRGAMAVDGRGKLVALPKSMLAAGLTRLRIRLSEGE